MTAVGAPKGEQGGPSHGLHDWALSICMIHSGGVSDKAGPRCRPQPADDVSHCSADAVTCILIISRVRNSAADACVAPDALSDVHGARISSTAWGAWPAQNPFQSGLLS